MGAIFYSRNRPKSMFLNLGCLVNWFSSPWVTVGRLVIKRDYQKRMFRPPRLLSSCGEKPSCFLSLWTLRNVAGVSPMQPIFIHSYDQAIAICCMIALKPLQFVFSPSRWSVTKRLSSAKFNQPCSGSWFLLHMIGKTKGHVLRRRQHYFLEQSTGGVVADEGLEEPGFP